MGKLKNFVILLSGLLLLFYFTGLLHGTASSTLLDMLLYPGNFGNSVLYLKIGAILAGVALISAVAFGFFNINYELVISSTFTLFLVSMLWDFIVVIQAMFAINSVLTIVIFSPILLLYTITIFEFWRGRDY